MNDALEAIIRISTPLLLAALGEMLLERSGVINIGTEGVMMAGAFCGFYAGLATGQPLIGALAGMCGGMLLMLIFALMTLRVGADQIVTGMAINLLAIGLTGTLYESLNTGQISGPVFSPVSDALRNVPLLGPLLFLQTPLTWAAMLLIPVLWFYLEKSERGMELRAVGENPAAAEASGIAVLLCRWKTCLAAGAICGLGGAFLSISQTASFVPNNTQGRGFVAIAAVVLGRYNALGTAAACLFFGTAFYIRDVLPSHIVPSQFVEFLPYLLTIVALCARSRSHSAPAALGKPYLK